MVLPLHILRYTISLFVNNALILRSVTIMFASWEHEYTLVYYTIEKKIKHCVTIYRHYIFWCISNTDGRGYSMTAYSTFRRDGFGLLEEKKHQLLKSESYVELVLILFSRWQSAAAPHAVHQDANETTVYNIDVRGGLVRSHVLILSSSTDRLDVFLVYTTRGDDGRTTRIDRFTSRSPVTSDGRENDPTEKRKNKTFYELLWPI